jgi:hypothetical protein
MRIETIFEQRFSSIIWGLIFDLRNPGEKTAVYEISLEASGVDQEMTLSTLP